MCKNTVKCDKTVENTVFSRVLTWNEKKGENMKLNYLTHP